MDSLAGQRDGNDITLGALHRFTSITTAGISGIPLDDPVNRFHLAVYCAGVELFAFQKTGGRSNYEFIWDAVVGRDETKGSTP